MKIRAVLNPRAGLAARRALVALRQGRPTWGPVPVDMTERPGHARELAREAARHGAELVLAVGGDGTVNEVAAGLLGSQTALGLVPMGSGNGLARTLGIPLKPPAALEALETGVVCRMDVGRINGGLFLNVAGTGFDAEVGAAFHTQGRKGARRGVWPYVRLGLKTLFRYRANRFDVRAGTWRYDGAALVVALFNGRQYGAGAVLAPRARLNDGRLDLVLIEDGSGLEALWQARRLFTGTIHRFARYRCTQAESVTLTADGLVAFHRDGEPEERVDRLAVTLEPRALRVLVPTAVAADPQGPFLPTPNR